MSELVLQVRIKSSTSANSIGSIIVLAHQSQVKAFDTMSRVFCLTFMPVLLDAGIVAEY